MVRWSGEEVLAVCVLTREIPGPAGETARWLARSVTTGHVAGGSTEEVALERLLTGVRILLKAARAEGVSAEDWFEASTVAEQHFIHEFKRQENAGHCDDLPTADRAGCRAAPRKAHYSLS